MRMLTFMKEELSMNAIEKLRQKLVINIILILLELSILVGTLHNAMLAYTSVFHFDEALKCADFILDHYHKDPEFYFRKAQVK